MTHIPTGSQPTPDAAQGPWGHQPAPGTPGQAAAPQPGPHQGWGAPMDPAATQAAWRYSARSKNNTVAWLLWLGGPFLIGLPIHDFYFGGAIEPATPAELEAAHHDHAEIESGEDEKVSTH